MKEISISISLYALIILLTISIFEISISEIIMTADWGLVLCLLCQFAATHIVVTKARKEWEE